MLVAMTSRMDGKPSARSPGVERRLWAEKR